MKAIPFLLLSGLLFTAAGCKKDKENAPSKTAMLSGVTWKESSQTMTLNGVAGNYTPSAANTTTYQFAANGTLTVTDGTSAPETGTWAFANNETQIKTTGAGNNPQTFELFELSSNKLAFGVNYNQTQIQTALAPNSGDILPYLILSAGNFTFPANTPTVPVAQLTSFRYQSNCVPR
ncbi:lipocalin family protein [Hymenobacter negativus]|uniref:Lipocalin family protein n=1 Tax=Hymenobacter negativus TaxID=2795026 RepID=A0ABS3QHT8_9BACT|nr:lipocalin family protein [Hymenobacter negativus]MBO2010805.1 lipocalin family protein [Hymenobacter negativus]